MEIITKIKSIKEDLLSLQTSGIAPHLIYITDNLRYDFIERLNVILKILEK